MLQHCNQFISLQIIKTFVKLNKEYQVENILEKQMINEKTHYLIRWKEYDTFKNISKPQKNLKNCVWTFQCFEKEIEN